MTEDEMRAALAEALVGPVYDLVSGRRGAGTADETLAEALLSTVRRIVAEELRAAALRMLRSPVPATHVPTIWREVDALRARADALDPRW